MTTIVPRRADSATATTTARVDRAARAAAPRSDAALLALITAAQSADDFKTASRRLCIGLRELAGCDRVVLALANRRGECRVVEVSDEVRVDNRSEITRASEAALDETLTRDELEHFEDRCSASWS